MLASQHSQGHHHQLSFECSHRRPLQPKNISNPSPNSNLYPQPQWSSSNKENLPPPPPMKKDVESFDGSLADELSAIRERLHRVKADRDRTEKLLRERSEMLDMQMKEILNRGEIQKLLEMELDRLYRLNEIKLASQRISPVRSLRDKEHEKRMMNQP